MLYLNVIMYEEITAPLLAGAVHVAVTKSVANVVTGALGLDGLEAAKI